MLADNSRNAHRCVALMMGVVFAAATSTQVSAQSRIDRLSQSSTEIPTASGGGQSVQTLGGQLAVFLGHEGKVNSAVFSPDGSKVLTASHDKTARLWDTKGNLLTLFQGHEDFVRNAVFSPNGSQILTASGDGTVRLWDTKGNLLTLFQGHKNEFASVLFSPDGSQILTARGDNTAHLWDTSGNLLAEFQHEGNVTSAVFNPDGSQILTARGDNTAHLWDTSGNLLAEFQHEGNVTSAVFNPDGSQILTASLDGTARLWNHSGNLLAEFQHEESVLSAVFNPDGSQILTTSWDRTVRLWDSSGNLIAEFGRYEILETISAAFSPDGSKIITVSNTKTTHLWDTKGNLLVELKGDMDEVKSLETQTDVESISSAVFSPDSSQILTTNSDKTVRLWDISAAIAAQTEQISALQAFHKGVSDNNAQLARFQGHEGDITDVVFSPDGSQILTSSYDKTARLWDTKGDLLVEFQGHEGYVFSAVFSRDGNQILTASSDNTARLWDTKGNLLAVLQGYEGFILNAVFSPDGRHIITNSENGTARLWDTKGNLLTIFQEGHAWINSAVFSPDGSQILTASMDGTVCLWDTSGNLLAEFQDYEISLFSAVFSPDGSQILTASADGTDGTARLWDTSGNLLVVFQGHKDSVTSAVFSPDGNQILTASDDGTARLWDTSGNLLTVFQGHEKEVNSAIFSPDGSQILTASADRTIRLWDIKGNALVIFRGHEEKLFSAVFSPDSRQIITGSSDNTARLWDVPAAIAAQADQLATSDPTRTRAEQLYDQGIQLFQQETAESQQQAIIKFEAALTLWRELGDKYWEADTLKYIGNSYSILRDTQQALDYYNQVLIVIKTSERSESVQSLEGSTIFSICVIYLEELGDKQKAIDFVQQYISNHQPENKLINSLDFFFTEYVYLLEDDILKSRILATDAQELLLRFYQSVGDKKKIAYQLDVLGNSYFSVAEWQKGLDYSTQALSLYREINDRSGEADIMISLGSMYHQLGEKEKAIDYYHQALSFFSATDNSQERAASIQYWLAETYYEVEEHQKALDYYNRALDFYNEALSINPSYRDDIIFKSAILSSIGELYRTLKDYQKSLNYHNQALALSQTEGDRIVEAFVLNNLGAVYSDLGEHQKALNNYNQALPIFQQAGNLDFEANTLYKIAYTQRNRGNLTQALANIEASIQIIENLRTKVASSELRQTYFATVQDYYQLYIDLLMQLHQQNPNKGYDALAFHASERARARSLIELLTEANADIRSGVDSQLLEQERNLTQQLNDLEYRKYQLLSTQHSQTELDDIQQKIDTILTQLNQLEAKIRIASPRYAELKYPEPLTLQQIQQQVLDEDTVLLEYSLGEDRSYLWVVTKDNITSYQLPPRSEIETAAKSFFSLTTDSRATIDEILPVSTQLTQLILPNLPQLSQKRLLIVPDGQLHYIPFSALSINPSDYQPLLTKHQVIHLPSASTVAINRNQLTQRAIAPNTLAIIADPIFSLNDERFNGKTNPSSNNNRGTENLASLSLERSATTSDIEFKPLPFTRTEADTILQLLPGKSSLSFFEFDANLNTVKRPDLSNYQIIHFATHGVLNPDYPELSGLVVSLVDRQGNPQNGFLRLNDIFNLNLPAELVVLSACQTGSGENVKGEGIVGLTRGFMYAGSPRVIASLWNVNDASTAELMKLFYQKYLQENLPPAEALRQAQLAMWQSDKEKIDWRTPYFWAAFTLQGEWR